MPIYAMRYFLLLILYSFPGELNSVTYLLQSGFGWCRSYFLWR